MSRKKTLQPITVICFIIAIAAPVWCGDQDINITLGDFKASPTQNTGSSEPLNLQPESATDDGPGQVMRVINADTIAVENFPETIQLAGIDAQETAYNLCYGKIAKQYVSQKVLGKKVRLVIASTADQFGRSLEFVWYLDGGREFCLNEQMIRDGIARVNPSTIFRDREKYIVLQADARLAKKGFWGHCIKWMRVGELGAFSVDPGGKRYRRAGQPTVFLRDVQLANGSYSRTFNKKNLKRSIFGYEPQKLFVDGTITGDNDIIIRSVEGEFGPGFKLRDVQTLMMRNPGISIQDFLLPAERNVSIARSYSGPGTEIGVW